jgi:hypothetical protein
LKNFLAIATVMLTLAGLTVIAEFALGLWH